MRLPSNRARTISTISDVLAAPIAGLFLLLASGSFAISEEIKVLSPIALEPVAKILIPEFEKSSGHKIAITFGTAGAIAERVQKGDASDVAITSAPLLENLLKQGMVLGDSKTAIAKVGLGVFVRKGTAKPEIGSIEEFKRALFAAKSIGFVNPSFGAPTGIYMTSLMDKLNIAEDMRAKTRLFLVEDRFDGIIRGDAELGFNQISEISADPRVDFVGPLPSDIQNYTSFATAIITTSKQAEAAKAFIAYFSSPASASVKKAKGFE